MFATFYNLKNVLKFLLQTLTKNFSHLRICKLKPLIILDNAICSSDGKLAN